MLSISSVYNDVALDNVNSAENGALSFAMFNRLSRRAELRMLDYLSGDIENIKPPMPYSAGKLKDILAPFITKYPAQVTNGNIIRPDDFYSYDSMVLLGDYNIQADCENEDEVTEGCNILIENLDSSVFDDRCTTAIEGLQPSFIKPITKMVGRTFEFLPTDLGSVVLQYLRYPIYGKIVTKTDLVYNDEVVDEDLSTNYEYDEFARELLVYFISDLFAIHTREVALKQTNQATGKLVRG